MRIDPNLRLPMVIQNFYEGKLPKNASNVLNAALPILMMHPTVATAAMIITGVINIADALADKSFGKPSMATLRCALFGTALLLTRTNPYSVAIVTAGFNVENAVRRFSLNKQSYGISLASNLSYMASLIKPTPQTLFISMLGAALLNLNSAMDLYKERKWEPRDMLLASQLTRATLRAFGCYQLVR